MRTKDIEDEPENSECKGKTQKMRISQAQRHRGATRAQGVYKTM
jgi:hypothetical protein